jgi:AraC-like DNA-binding protein
MKQAPSGQDPLADTDLGAHLLRLLDHLPEVWFYVKDRQGRFLALNRRGCEVCGVRTEREALGRTDADFFPQVRAREFRADDQRVMRSGRPAVNRVHPAPAPAGSPRLAVSTKLPLRDRRGRVVGVVGFSRPLEGLRGRGGAALDRLLRAIEHLHRHLADDLTLDALARRAGLSRSQFARSFRQAFGTSPRQYVLRARVDEAGRRLRETDQTVSEIAADLGFHDHAHFSRRFRRLAGLSPTAYRRTLAP